MDFVQSSGMVSFIHISLQMWYSWSMMQPPPYLRSSPVISSVPVAFPRFQLFDSCFNFRAKDDRLTTVLRPKGWCVKTGRINGRLMIVQCLSIFKPPLFHLIWIGKKFTTTTTDRARCRTPIYPFGNSLDGIKDFLALVLLHVCLLYLAFSIEPLFFVSF